MNNVSLIGRWTKDPELRKTETTNKSVMNCVLAVSNDFDREKTDFIPVVAWEGIAENTSKYTRKGSKVGVSGHITSRNYQDKNGNNKVAYELVATRIEFLEDKKKDESESDTSFDFGY